MTDGSYALRPGGGVSREWMDKATAAILATDEAMTKWRKVKALAFSGASGFAVIGEGEAAIASGAIPLAGVLEVFRWEAARTVYAMMELGLDAQKSWDELSIKGLPDLPYPRKKAVEPNQPVAPPEAPEVSASGTCRLFPREAPVKPEIRVWQIVGYLREPFQGEGPTAREALLWGLGDMHIEEEVMEDASSDGIRFELRPYLEDETLGEMEEVILKSEDVSPTEPIYRWEE